MPTKSTATGTPRVAHSKPRPSLLMEMSQAPSNIKNSCSKTQPNGTTINNEVLESLLAGPGGFLKVESIWQILSDGSRKLTTTIPFGG